MRRAFAMVALVGLAALAVPASPPPRSTQRPTLLVVVMVDGLSLDRLTAWRPAWTGGFAQLLSEGHVAARTHYAHLNTETCPGHASVSTGAPPRVTGVVGNQWYQRGRRQSCVSDAVGPGNLRVDGLGDVLGSGSRVVSLSGKDRSAMLLAGRGRRHAAFWYDRKTGRFRTSGAYERTAPVVAAVQAIVDRVPLGQDKTLWERLPPGPGPAVPTVPARTLAERQIQDVGPRFPHDTAGHEGGALAGFYDSPFVDTFVTDLALAVLADPRLALGRGSGTDLLALSFASPDNVAHAYGDGSEEQLDTLRRLDAHLGRLLAALRRLPGGSVVLGLSADHGFLPADFPEEQRLDTEPDGGALDALNEALRARLCLPPAWTPVIGMTCWHLYVDPRAERKTTGAACGKPRHLDQALRSAVPDALLTLWPKAVAAVVPAGSAPPASLRPFVENATYAGRSGDFLVFPRPGALSHWEPARGWGHGSHHAYDTHVPLIFWGNGVAAGCSDAPSAPYDLAPTLADYAGVRLPQATGQSLRTRIVEGAGRTCAETR